MGMRTRTYRARSMREALEKVREDLGGEALILGSREVVRRRFWGRAPRVLVEVDAALPSSGLEAGGGVVDSGARRGSGADSAGAGVLPNAQATRAAVGQELGQIHALVEAVTRSGRIDHLIPDLPPSLIAAYAALLESDAPEILARRLVRLAAEVLEPEQLSDPRMVTRAIREALADMIPTAPPIPLGGGRRIIALVGPTGVGKTTTVAKLAANLKLSSSARIGLLTVDTYRIAAVEQLRTYAEIIDIPLAVADEPAAMRPALESLGDTDLVFIDTAGRSPKDELKIRELAEFLEQAQPDQVHLVLAATSSPQSLRAAVDRFAPTGVNRFILSKLDEVEQPGALLAAVALSTKPLSYITTGQTVPDDIEPADRHRLARIIVGQDVLAVNS